MLKKQIFVAAAACRSALMEFSNQHTCTEEQRNAIEQGYMAIMQAIQEISAACVSKKKANCRGYVSDILHDLHPRTDYVHDEKLIRDLADICVTLRVACEGKLRGPQKGRDKLIEATFFFDLARDIK